MFRDPPTPQDSATPRNGSAAPDGAPCAAGRAYSLPIPRHPRSGPETWSRWQNLRGTPTACPGPGSRRSRASKVNRTSRSTSPGSFSVRAHVFSAVTRSASRDRRAESGWFCATGSPAQFKPGARPSAAGAARIQASRPRKLLRIMMSSRCSGIRRAREFGRTAVPDASTRHHGRSTIPSSACSTAFASFGITLVPSTVGRPFRLDSPWRWLVPVGRSFVVNGKSVASACGSRPGGGVGGRVAETPVRRAFHSAVADGGLRGR